MWFPKQQSNEITNMIAKLNHELGGLYFTVAYTDNGLYTLNRTKICISKKKYNYVSFEGGKSFSEMYNYIQGILYGIRMLKDNK